MSSRTEREEFRQTRTDLDAQQGSAFQQSVILAFVRIRGVSHARKRPTLGCPKSGVHTYTSVQLAGARKLLPVFSLQPPAGSVVPQLMRAPPIAPNGRPSLSGCRLTVRIVP